MAEPVRCVILGGGGHAGVLLDALEAAGGALVHGILDRDRTLWNTAAHGVRVLGGDELLAVLAREGVAAFVVGLGSVGYNPLRRELFQRGVEAGLRALTVRHPAASVSRRALLGAGAAVLAGAIVNAAARVGENAIVNSGAIVEHDCEVGAHAHLATGARLAGGVRVGAEAFVGAGATVKQGLRIGDGAVVGAGAVVLRDVPARGRVAGVPARPL